MLVISESDTADMEVRRAPVPPPSAARAAAAPSSPPVPGLLVRRLALSVVVVGGGGGDGDTGNVDRDGGSGKADRGGSGGIADRGGGAHRGGAGDTGETIVVIIIGRGGVGGGGSGKGLPSPSTIGPTSGVVAVDDVTDGARSVELRVLDTCDDPLDPPLAVDARLLELAPLPARTAPAAGACAMNAALPCARSHFCATRDAAATARSTNTRAGEAGGVCASRSMTGCVSQGTDRNRNRKKERQTHLGKAAHTASRAASAESQDHAPHAGAARCAPPRAAAAAQPHQYPPDPASSCAIH